MRRAFVRGAARAAFLSSAVSCGPIGSAGGAYTAPMDSGASSSGSASSGSTGSAGSSGSSASSGSESDAAGAPDIGNGTTTSGGCVDMAMASGTVAQQYGSAQIAAGADKTYFLQSNWWHTYANESESYTGLSFTVHNPQGASVPASDGAPMGFPSIFIGQYAGNATMGSNLPKQVSALTSVPTIYQTNNTSVGMSNHNAAYDVWFTQGSSPLSLGQSNPGAGGAYLMVWMFKPTDRQPRGNDNGRTGQTVAGVSGTWNVWVDTTNPPCVSYVSAMPRDGLAFDLNDFIKDAVAKGYGLKSSMYLSIVFGGFEVWGQADGLSLTQFCATVN